MREQIRPPLLSRIPTWTWVAIDSVIAVVLAASFVGLATSRNDTPPDVLDHAAALATALPIAVRRLWPRAVFLVVLIGGLGMREFLDPHTDPACLPLALYTLATRGKAVIPLLAAAAVGLQGVVELPLSAGVRDDLGLALAVPLAGWAVSTAVRQRRLYTERLAAHAGERARAEAAEERLRIARELHDVIGHSLSTIAVQAGVAGHVNTAEQMRSALASIEETSRSALRETRLLLGVLRAEPRPGDGTEPRPGDAARLPGDGTAPLPDGTARLSGDGAGGRADLAPGLADLDALVERTRAAGLEVELVIDGPVREEMELTVYRIVQEALTNVLKHAGARHACVRIERQDDGMLVEVSDGGTRARARPYGHGLTGLRERVHLFGGEFEAGPDARSGGFRVTARLPL